MLALKRRFKVLIGRALHTLVCVGGINSDMERRELEGFASERVVVSNNVRNLENSTQH